MTTREALSIAILVLQGDFDFSSVVKKVAAEKLDASYGSSMNPIPFHEIREELKEGL